MDSVRSPLAPDLCQAGGMKNKNKRELEKHWADQLEKERKKHLSTPANKRVTVQRRAAIIRNESPRNESPEQPDAPKHRDEHSSQAAAPIVKEATEDK